MYVNLLASQQRYKKKRHPKVTNIPISAKTMCKVKLYFNMQEVTIAYNTVASPSLSKRLGSIFLWFAVADSHRNLVLHCHYLVILALPTSLTPSSSSGLWAFLKKRNWCHNSSRKRSDFLCFLSPLKLYEAWLHVKS